jgi:hypothetical protein
MDDELFLSWQHPVSRRWAVVEDDGRAAWLYLTRPDGTEPVAACWLYNRVPAPAGCDSSRGEPSVVPASHAVSPEPHPAPDEGAVSLRWSADGDSVAVLLDGRLAGFIAHATEPGYSAQLRQSGVFGNILDEELYAAVFGPVPPARGGHGDG